MTKEPEQLKEKGRCCRISQEVGDASVEPSPTATRKIDNGSITWEMTDDVFASIKAGLESE